MRAWWQVHRLLCCRLEVVWDSMRLKMDWYMVHLKNKSLERMWNGLEWISCKQLLNQANLGLVLALPFLAYRVYASGLPCVRLYFFTCAGTGHWPLIPSPWKWDCGWGNSFGMCRGGWMGAVSCTMEYLTSWPLPTNDTSIPQLWQPGMSANVTCPFYG